MDTKDGYSSTAFNQAMLPQPNVAQMLKLAALAASQPKVKWGKHLLERFKYDADGKKTHQLHATKGWRRA